MDGEALVTERDWIILGYLCWLLSSSRARKELYMLSLRFIIARKAWVRRWSLWDLLLVCGAVSSTKPVAAALTQTLQPPATSTHHMQRVCLPLVIFPFAAWSTQLLRNNARKSPVLVPKFYKCCERRLNSGRVRPSEDSSIEFAKMWLNTLLVRWPTRWVFGNSNVTLA